MKALLLTLPLFGFVSCSSFQSAQYAADYNRDGYVSQAENAQFQRQKNVEDRAVYSEGVKRRGVVNTVRDASDTLYHARRAQSLWRSF